MTSLCQNVNKPAICKDPGLHNVYFYLGMQREGIFNSLQYCRRELTLHIVNPPQPKPSEATYPILSPQVIPGVEVFNCRDTTVALRLRRSDKSTREHPDPTSSEKSLRAPSVSLTTGTSMQVPRLLSNMAMFSPSMLTHTSATKNQDVLKILRESVSSY